MIFVAMYYTMLAMLVMLGIVFLALLWIAKWIVAFVIAIIIVVFDLDRPIWRPSPTRPIPQARYSNRR